jgi:hypothetical protein
MFGLQGQGKVEDQPHAARMRAYGKVNLMACSTMRSRHRSPGSPTKDGWHSPVGNGDSPSTMVVTRNAFRTLGAADDPDSTVPCQLPYRVCDLDDHRSLWFDNSFVCLSRSCLVSRKQARKQGRAKAGSGNSQCNISIEYTASMHRDPHGPASRCKIWIIQRDTVEFPPRAGDNLQACSTSVHSLQETGPKTEPHSGD